MHRQAFALVLLLSAASALSQNVTGGSLFFQQGGTLPINGISYIDYGRPITADGTITNAALRWLTDNACTGAFRIRIFRPVTGSTSNFTLVGETSAFNVTPGNNLQLVNFTGISVKKGDLVGIAQTAAVSGCGGATFSESTHPGDVVYQINTNYTGGNLPGIELRRGYRLDLVVSDAAQRFAGVIPVVGSAQGVGAFFRSSLQLTNPAPWAIDGKLVFHAAGQAGSASDPSLTFHLDPSASKSYDDIAASFGRTGLGTVDVYTSTFIPEVTAYVYNDLGAAGTFGFSEELVTPEEMFSSAMEYAILPVATDLTNFRVNVGIRTLAATTVGVNVYDAAGTFKGSVEPRAFAANYFEQMTLGQLLGAIAPPPGGRVFIYVASGGPAVFYSSTLDNRTNDGRVKMVIAK